MSLVALLFIKTSITFGLPPGLLSAICFVESRHNVNAIRIHDGNSDSYGICQIKLATARQVGFKGSADELKKAKTNIYYAGAYLQHKLRINGGSVHRAVSAYNAGTATTVNSQYVNKVLTIWEAEIEKEKPNEDF